MNFRPSEVSETSPIRAIMLRAGPAVSALTRAAWRRSKASRSTWFDTRLWRTIWNVNRLFSCIPRARSHLVDVRLSPSIRMQLDLSRLTDVLAYCYGPGEGDVGHVCSMLCSPDAVIVDVGGNVGTTALSFAETAPQGTVHVFEPSPDMLSALRRSVELSRAGNVIVHPYGLADRSCRMKLEVAISGNPGSAFMTEPDGHEGPQVEVKRLDDVLAGAPRIDFVKIDVEGYEQHVLLGGETTVRKHRPALVVELNEVALQRQGRSSTEVRHSLAGMGYDLFCLDRGRLRAYAAAQADPRGLHNLIAIHPESRIAEHASRWLPGSAKAVG